MLYLLLINNYKYKIMRVPKLSHAIWYCICGRCLNCQSEVRIFGVKNEKYPNFTYSFKQFKENDDVYEGCYSESKGISAEGCYLNYYETPNAVFIPVFKQEKDKKAFEHTKKFLTKK